MKPSKTTPMYNPKGYTTQFVNLIEGGRWVGSPARVIRKIAALVLLMSFAVGVQAKDRREILEAIHMVENPTNSTRVGSHGELGAYQFRPTTWRMHTKRPFHLAVNRSESDLVAERHYEWIKTGLEQNGLEASPYWVALAWNAGLSATVNGNVGIASVSYARRVDNLVGDLKRQQVAEK